MILNSKKNIATLLIALISFFGFLLSPQITSAQEGTTEPTTTGSTGTVGPTTTDENNGTNSETSSENSSSTGTNTGDPARGTTVEDIKINYTGGKNNINRFIPQEFRNETFKDEAKLRLPGYSIKIMTPEDEEFIRNVEQTIRIIEYLKNTIGLKEIVKQKADFMNLKLTDDGSSDKTVQDILTDSKFVSPVISPDKFTADELENALFDLKEHLPEGAIENFIFGFIRLNLLIIQVMSIFFLIYGGYLWVTSQGEEGNIEKGKNIIMWSVVAMIGAAICYVIISIITQMFTN